MNPSSTPPRYPRFAGQPLRSLRSVGNEMKKTSGSPVPRSFSCNFYSSVPVGRHAQSRRAAGDHFREEEKAAVFICNGPQILPDTLAGVFQITFLFYPEIIKETFRSAEFS